MAVVDLLRSMLQRLWYYREVFYALYCILGATFIASCASVLLECKPLSEYWQVDFQYDACKTPDVWIVTYESGNILTDFLLLLLPFPIIFKANLPVWKRLRLSVVFGLGLLLVGMNIIRLYRGLHPWGLFNASQRLLWSSVEMTVAAVVATLPTIYILLRPSFYKIRKEESAAHAAAAPGQREMQQQPQQQQKSRNSSWPSWATSEVVYDGGGDAARRTTTPGGTGGQPRTPWMAHVRSGMRVPPTPITSGVVPGDDSWGRGPWSGGHQWCDTQISSGGYGGGGGGSGSGTVSTSASASATNRSRRSMDRDNNNRECASGVITVETVVEQEIVDIAEMGEITEITSFMTLPPMAKFHSRPM